MRLGGEWWGRGSRGGRCGCPGKLEGGGGSVGLWVRESGGIEESGVGWWIGGLVGWWKRRMENGEKRVRVGFIVEGVVGVGR